MYKGTQFEKDSLQVLKFLGSSLQGFTVLQVNLNSCLQISMFTKSFVSRKPIKIIQICKILLKKISSATFLRNKHENDSINFFLCQKRRTRIISKMAWTPYADL